jgi:SAM-dependent methyltransferase
MSTDSTRDGYDRVADEYAARMAGELDHKPFDREILARFAEKLRGRGPVVDLGCGPGQIAAFLASHGVDARGIDLSPGMIEQARRLHPGLDFAVGDMRALDLADASLAGITAFYSLIHIPRDELALVLEELRRVLRGDGLLLAAFHLGSAVQHLDEWWGRPVSIDFVFFERDEMERKLRAAGFEIEDVKERDPYPDVEAQTRRAYVLVAPA